MTYSLAAASKSLSGLMPQTSPATYVILTVSCALFAVSLLLTMRLGGGWMAKGGNPLSMLFGMGAISGQVLERLGASLPLPYDLHEPWRFVLAIFLHGGLIHIGFNMWVLMDVGPMIEEIYGSAMYLFLYITTGAAGYLLSSALGHFSVGASSSLLGLIGLLLAVTSRRGGAAMHMMRGQLIMWVVIIFLMGFGMGGIDNAAHLGGLVSGFLLGRIVPDREPATVGERKRAQALGWLTALIILASFTSMFFYFFRTA